MHFRRELVAGPHGLAWAVAWSFMVGSSLFALGSFPLYSQRVGAGVVGSTFVLGSIFFTAAAYGQFVQVVSEQNGEDPGGRRYVAWQPGRRAWWMATVQLVGTLLFNVNTINATVEGLTAQEANRLVWAPDMFGSAAFLIASHLAWVELCGRRWRYRPDDAEWWSTAVNYLGSIFFGLSALAALTLPTTGEVLNTTLVNSATFLGALCFLFGAYLLLPEARGEPEGAASADRDL